MLSQHTLSSRNDDCWSANVFHTSSSLHWAHHPSPSGQLRENFDPDDPVVNDDDEDDYVVICRG